MTATKNYPRLLVASEFPPNVSGGGGTIVRQMLKDWPVDRLFWWSCQPDRDRRFGQQVAAHRVATIPTRLYPYRRLRWQKTFLLKHVWSRWAAHHFRKTLSLFKPDVVWALPISWSIPPLVKALLPANIPFHVSVMDYADCSGWVRQFGAAQACLLQEQLELLYARATTRDAIYYPMIADLRARTGRDADGPVHAGLEKEDFEYLQTKTVVPDDQIRIAYTGTISYEEDFAKFVQALAAVRHKFTKKVSLEIFSSHSYRDRLWFDASWMNERGNMAEPQFSAEVRKCAWGFAMMSLAEENRSDRFSLPTKFASSVATGLPVFALGHPESSLIKAAQQYRVGVCATSGEQEYLRSKVLEAFSIKNPWEIFGPEIRRCAREEFDAARTRQMLHQCFFTGILASPKM
jgi:hypothetical protein